MAVYWQRDNRFREPSMTLREFAQIVACAVGIPLIGFVCERISHVI